MIVYVINIENGTQLKKNKMKAAILVYGMCTAFDIAVKSWKFLNDIDCDVYFSTWNRHKKYSEKLNYLSEFDVNEEMIKKNLSKVNLMISDEKNYNFNTTIERIVFHWKNCLRMMDERNINYDIMILTRPENYINYEFNSLEFFNKKEKDRIYGLENIQIVGLNRYFVQDIFFTGDYEVMYDLLSTMSTDVSDLHGKLAEHIVFKNLYVEPIKNLGVMTLRPNCEELNNKPYNMEILWNKVQEWG